MPIVGTQAIVTSPRRALPVSRISFSVDESSSLALMGFGGVMPIAYRALVEQQKWLTAEEFAHYLAMNQMLPGPSIFNVSLMVGNRYAGPFFIVIGLGIVYQQFGELPLFRNAISGMAAVASGLILATSMKMAQSLFAKADWRDRRYRLKAALLALAFIGLGVLQWKLVVVFCLLAPLGTAAALGMAQL